MASFILHITVSNQVSYFFQFEFSQEREYFGLRDFYSLIKMLSTMVKLTPETPSYRSVELCVKRNFGGNYCRNIPRISSITRLLPARIRDYPNEFH